MPTNPQRVETKDIGWLQLPRVLPSDSCIWQTGINLGFFSLEGNARSD